MKKNQPHTDENLSNDHSFSDVLPEENKFAEWLTLYYKELGLGLAVFVAILVAFLIYSARNSVKAETDYLAAQNNYHIFQTGDSADSAAAFNELQEVINRRPELNAKYDGIIAQEFINTHHPDQAEKYALLTFQRTADDNLQYYTDYAKTTLLIGKQNYEEALKNANELKSKMLNDAIIADQDPKRQPFGDTLFAYNLIRIAMLDQQMTLSQEELKAWEELKMYAGLSKAPSGFKFLHPLAIQILFSNFEDGKASLKNYIESREKMLKAN
jgi:predicted negative regulator of RcsB-dependent stress response